jgi:hypothetical protein
MSILQDPIAALDQADWYLQTSHLEKFPGAFELAAGNLCRQTLEQVLFILCFFSGMPHKLFMRSDRTLKVAGALFKQLDKIDSVSNKTYRELARTKSPRIRKFAMRFQTLRKWQRILNEPAHFSTKFRTVDADRLSSYIQLARGWFDDKDKHLIVAALNEVLSHSRVQATIENDSDNTPGICWRVVVTAHNLERTVKGALALRGPEKPFLVIPENQVPRGTWPRIPVLVQHSVGISIGVQFVTKHGTPVDISNGEGVLRTFSSTPGERSYLSRRLRQLGLEVRFKKKRLNADS